MSQTEFGERLGVSRSVIKNIELNNLAKPEQKLSLIKLMCKEFNVSEDWLLNGSGEMYIHEETFSLDDFCRDHGATDLEIEILKTYFTLDPEIRRAATEHFVKCLGKKKSSDIPDTPEEFEKKYPPNEDSENNDSAGQYMQAPGLPLYTTLLHLLLLKNYDLRFLAEIQIVINNILFPVKYRKNVSAVHFNVFFNHKHALPSNVGGGCLLKCNRIFFDISVFTDFMEVYL